MKYGVLPNLLLLIVGTVVPGTALACALRKPDVYIPHQTLTLVNPGAVAIGSVIPTIPALSEVVFTEVFRCPDGSLNVREYMEGTLGVVGTFDGTHSIYDSGVPGIGLVFDIGDPNRPMVGLMGNPSGASHDVALESASHNVAPYAGAVVLLPFKTSNGLAMLIRTLDQDGAPLPFGANVFDEDGNNVGVVGQAGKAFVRTVHPQGELTVRWGSRGDQQCVMPYVLQEQGSPGELRQLQGQCSWLKDAPLATAERQPPMLSDIPHE